MVEGNPCVCRRDIVLRSFPSVPGASPTAMEINVTDGTADESAFMQGLLNPSEYSFNLGANYSRILHDKFSLNARYRRAWWINPGFVWNRQQMASAAMNRYTVSQRLALILLVGLDEPDGYR